MRIAVVVALALALPLSLAAQEPAKPEAPAAPPAASPAPTAEKASEKTTAKTAAKTELKVGTAVENKEVSGAAAEFKIAPDTKLFAWAKVTGVPADGKVTLAFFKGDKEAFKKELTVGGSPWRVNAYKTFRAGDAGDWTAKLLGPDGAELSATSFKVEIQK